MKKNAVLATLLIPLLLGASGPAKAQLPTPDSGTFRTHPLVPTVAANIHLELHGEYPFSNGQMDLVEIDIEPELVRIDLTTSWAAGTSAADEVVTTWQINADLGILTEGVYDILVRVDGTQFLFSYFVVEAEPPEPAPLPHPVQTVAPQRPLGINLAPLKDHTHTLTFVDIFKPSRSWIPHRPSDDTWDTGQALDLDAKGWVRSLQPDQEAGTLMMLEIGDAYPGGHYTVFYQGSGVLDFEWDARVIDTQPGRIDLWVTPQEGIHVIIRQTDPKDYIRNIRVLMPGHQQSFQRQPFHPNYIEFLQQFSLIRFMDWMDSNEPENVSEAAGMWANRITPDHASQGTIRGVAWEYQIELANQVGADPWFNLPITATDAYAESLATLIRDRLDPQRTPWIELSNEVWNRDFPQHEVAARRGLDRGYGDPEAAARFAHLSPSPEGLLAALRYQSSRSVEIFAIFEQVLGSSAHFRRVICGWGVDDTDLAVEIALELLDWRDTHQVVDAYAIAPYFGFFIAQDDFSDRAVSLGVAALLDSVATNMRFMLEVGRALAQLTGQRGLDLVTYEAGHHMVQATETPYPNAQVRAKVDLVHGDQRMYDIYAEYLAGWFEYGQQMNLFNDFLALGNFGLASRWDQSPIYPKHRAVLDFLQTTAPEDSLSLAITGDGDGDGDVDFDDFFAFAEAFGSQNTSFDLNADGIVDLNDFFVFADHFGTGVQ